MGDPAGIGPEVISKSLNSLIEDCPARFVVVADKEVMDIFWSKKLKDRITYLEPEGFACPESPGIYLVDPDTAMAPGHKGPTEKGSVKAKKCIDTALELMKDVSCGTQRALVTGPVSKYHFSLIAPGFSGHTEYLRDFHEKERVTMAMAGRHLKVVPLTRHIPLRTVSEKITYPFLKKAIEQVIDSRHVLSEKSEPKIGVCALNPHAGEAGSMGVEEIDVIIPVIECLRKEKYPSLIGPLPSDVAFYKALKKDVDIVLGMYHDQCLAPFKMLDFDNGVNVTLGLDYVRTSPDHGTAFDIAGKGKAFSGSMEEAIKFALRATSRIPPSESF